MMTKKIFTIGMIALYGLLISSCGDDDSSSGPSIELAEFSVTFNNLEPITNAVYEAWIIGDGAPISAGIFDAASSEYTFITLKDSLEKATKFVVSIEPINDPDPSPSDTKILSGDFVNDRAEVTFAEVGDFDNIRGNFEIFTPSDTDDTNEENGVWFLKTAGDTQEAGLELPTLPTGWKYEGWVIINEIPVSTGAFTKLDEFDGISPYSSDRTTPNFPGQDFLNGIISVGTTAISFPTDGNVTGKTVVISLEPSPDNDPAPFYIKPLIGQAGTALSPAANPLESNFTVVNQPPVGLVKR